jgi:hypothetical protein
VTLQSTLQHGVPNWSCSGSPGDQTTVCITNDSIPRHTVARNLTVTTSIGTQPVVDGSAEATLEGGGAALFTSASARIPISSAPVDFGIVAGSLLADSFAADGVTPERAAGAHPYQTVVGFDLATAGSPPAAPTSIAPAGTIRHFELRMPPGFVGDPTAPGSCSPPLLMVSLCPASSQVGRVDLATGPFPFSGFPKTYSRPLFNMQNPRGALADLGFTFFGIPVHVRFSLDPANHYAVVARAADVNEMESLLDMRMTLWGVPGDVSHDSERCPVGEFGQMDTSAECPAGVARRPFLTLPSECGGGQSVTFGGYDSWQESGAFGPPISIALPGKVVECGRPRFEPQLRASPTSVRASSPTSLELDFTVPQEKGPDAVATPPIEDVHALLPAGVGISPSFGNGLEACSESEAALGTNLPVTCPDASRIGEATVQTPLLPQPLHGYVYVATPWRNPSREFLALYVVVADGEGRGVLLKLSGRLDLDATTGRISAAFDDLPQLPFEELSLRFRGGPRAPLAAGPDCGPEALEASVSSFARPAEPSELTVSYKIDEQPGGAPCTPDSARPFSPAVSAGTLAPAARASTPLLFSVGRSDGEEELSRVAATLPAGLSATTAGIPVCPDSTIAAISGEEIGPDPGNRSACPSSSRVGAAAITAGPGPEPFHMSGSAYLAGPYRGAPLSLLVTVPAVAGPFDLGTVATRMAIWVNPFTARLRVESDPLPRILSGVPVDLRRLRIDLDRPGLVVNPSSCDPMSIPATATSSSGTVASAAVHFQATGCGSLSFNPRVALRLSGGVGRNGHPALRAVLRARAGEAGLAGAAFTLPPGELLDLTRIRAICGRRLPAERCPGGSRLGHARIWSPLLDVPLEGPVYLREPRHRLPDLLADLRSGHIHLVLHAHAAAPGGSLRLRFSALPDVPFSKAVVTLDGGRRGIIVNSESLCARDLGARTSLSSHSGRRLQARTRLRVDGRC